MQKLFLPAHLFQNQRIPNSSERQTWTRSSVFPTCTCRWTTLGRSTADFSSWRGSEMAHRYSLRWTAPGFQTRLTSVFERSWMITSLLKENCNNVTKILEFKNPLAPAAQSWVEVSYSIFFLMTFVLHRSVLKTRNLNSWQRLLWFFCHWQNFCNPEEYSPNHILKC
jgi:hypothetical protein